MPRCGLAVPVFLLEVLGLDGGFGSECGGGGESFGPLIYIRIPLGLGLGLGEVPLSWRVRAQVVVGAEAFGSGLQSIFA